MKKSANILKISFNTDSKDDILKYIITGLKSFHHKTVIVTPNPELVVLAHHDTQYRTVLNSAHISLPDGIGIVWASNVLNKGIRQRITGVDFMKSLCEKVSDLTDKGSEKIVTVGLFGADDGVAVRTAECLQKMYSGINIVYASHVPPSHKVPIDILFVALGSPKQEEWIYKNIDNLQVKVIMGVGGAFDMISGKVRRAPLLFQRIGMEWFWRLLIQPWRIKRQLKLIEFVWLVLLEKFRADSGTITQ